MEFLAKDDVHDSAGHAAQGKTRVRVKIAIFSGKMSIDDMLGEGIELDGGAALVGEYLVDELAVAV